VPPPFSTFEATGFPDEILKEVLSYFFLVRLCFLCISSSILPSKFAEVRNLLFPCKILQLLEFRLKLIVLHLYFLSQMRYLLQGGANVVRCAALCWRAL